MSNAKIDKTYVTIETDKIDIPFSTEGEVIDFDGFMKVYNPTRETEAKEESFDNDLPKLNIGEGLNKKIVLITQVTLDHPLDLQKLH